MQIDLPTLMIAGSFVAAVSGMFLIFSWLHTDRANGMLWWACANLLLAAAIPMMASTDARPGAPEVIVATTLLNISPALIWAAARATNGRRVEYLLIGAGAVLWLTAFALPVVRTSAGAQTGINLAIVATFLFAAAYEFWHGRAERLMARWPLIVLLVLHAGFAAAGAAGAFIGVFNGTGVNSLSDWFGFVHFETLAFVIGTSIFTVAITRERNEMRHKVAANTDSLTSVATRRSFYENGEEMLRESQRTDEPLAAILFDIDGFKQINDTFGHGPGDDVLRAFGKAATQTLRSSDLVGRLGGEEFGVLLPGASIGAAYVAAERIRKAFANACREIGDLTINATVSAGIAQAHAQMSLEELLQAADLALYRAKMHGRDRVEVTVRDNGLRPPPAKAPLKVA